MRILFCWITAFCFAAAICPVTTGADDIHVDRTSMWHGFHREHFQVAGRSAWLVVPDRPAKGNPWVWRARFPDFHYEMDVELLRRGFHIGYVDVAGLFGSPQAMQIGEAFYQSVTRSRDLHSRCAMEGVSRGGLFVYHWTMRHPERVACIYCDTPVLDFKSWPGGKGTGIGSPAAWKQCLQAWQMTEDEALAFDGNPVDKAATMLLKHSIPVLHIVSENDRVVPPAENTYLLQQRLRKAGADLPVISVKLGTAKSNGHHFTHPDPDRVVHFIENNARPGKGE